MLWLPVARVHNANDYALTQPIIHFTETATNNHTSTPKKCTFTSHNSHHTHTTPDKRSSVSASFVTSRKRWSVSRYQRPESLTLASQTSGHLDAAASSLWSIPNPMHPNVDHKFCGKHEADLQFHRLRPDRLPLLLRFHASVRIAVLVRSRCQCVRAHCSGVLLREMIAGEGCTCTCI